MVTWRGCVGLMLAAVIGVASIATATPRTALGRPLRAGERIVVVGDSITGDPGKEGRYVSLLRDALTDRYPTLNVTVHGAGVSNDTVHHVAARLRRDVLALRPTIVVVFVGLNDARAWPKPPNATAAQLTAYGSHLADYERALAAIVREIRRAGSDLVLCTPAVDGEQLEQNPADATMIDYVDATRQIAGRGDVPLCDLRRAFLDELQVKNRRQVKFGILTVDGVHLNEAGSQVVRDTILKALGP